MSPGEWIALASLVVVVLSGLVTGLVTMTRSQTRIESKVDGLTGLVRSQELENAKIWGRLEKHDTAIQAHEIRIAKIEQQ